MAYNASAKRRALSAIPRITRVLWKRIHVADKEQNIRNSTQKNACLLCYPLAKSSTQLIPTKKMLVGPTGKYNRLPHTCVLDSVHIFFFVNFMKILSTYFFFLCEQKFNFKSLSCDLKKKKNHK